MSSHTSDQLLQRVQAFWDSGPCDGAQALSDRVRYRYAKDGWVLDVLRRVAQNKKILEVGCGQGTDAITCCGLMEPGGTYIGIDYSSISVESAKEGLQIVDRTLSVRPSFRLGNAEALDFPDNTFDCVLSIGVLHHTPKTIKAFEEIQRVLRVGGTAYIAVYRYFSPKVMGALVLRAVSNLGERIIGKPGYGLELSKSLGTERRWGTMIHEAVGVPILKSYTRQEAIGLTSSFRSATVAITGFGFAIFSSAARTGQLLDKTLGAMWLIEAKK